MAGYPEGTSILLDQSSGEVAVAPGYPAIPRLLLIEKIKDIFRGKSVVVEEKVNGYNVRALYFGGKVLTLTRGGHVCPYTQHKIVKLYGEGLKSVLRDNPSLVLYGEAIGAHNPYVRYHGYADISFDYVLFDAFREGKFLRIGERNELAFSAGLKVPESFGTYAPEEYVKIIDLSVELEKRQVEGFVIKDLDNTTRVKYTLTSTNIGDIREGMRYFFEEGKTYIYPRVLREIFRQYELQKYGHRPQRGIYTELGKALLQPSVEAVLKTSRGEPSDEEFTLRVDDLSVLADFLQFMETLKMPIVVLEITTVDGEYEARCVKIRRTPAAIRRVLSSGISPED